ncbi:MAG: hypothetical protein WC656_11900 [Sulfurimonas sp.]|jgi:hypothetical protein
MSDFDKDLKNLELPYTMQLSNNSDTLLITFAGISGAIGLYPFEFFKITKSFNVDKIFIRDLNQSWYHKGLKDISTSIEETALFLKKIIEKQKYSKVVCLGNSMGGYAAIVIGELIGADVVLSFAPQTFLDDENRDKFSDNRWKEQITLLPQNIDKKYLDLNLFLKDKTTQTKIELYFSLDERIDVAHVQFIQDNPSVTIYPFLEGGHQLVQKLRKSGDLYRILRNHLSNSKEEKILSVFKEIESGVEIQLSLLKHNVEFDTFLNFYNKHVTLQKFQGELLYQFFGHVNLFLKNKMKFSIADEKIKNRSIYTRDKTIDWFSSKINRHQIFGSFIDFGHPFLLLHMQVGSKNLHIGFAKYEIIDDNYLIVALKMDDFKTILYKTEIKELVYRPWNEGWCSIDCGQYNDLSQTDKLATLTNFIQTDWYNEVFNPLIQTCQRLNHDK